MRRAATSPSKNKARQSALLVAGITAILCLLALTLVFFGHQGLYQVYLLRQEKARLEAENHRLAEENTRLARIVDRLHHDPEMIQDLIRQELNFVRKHELILQLRPKGEEAPSQAALLPDRPPRGATAGSPGPQRPKPAGEGRKPRP